jgi:hypothetical protein
LREDEGGGGESEEGEEESGGDHGEIGRWGGEQRSRGRR